MALSATTLEYKIRFHDAVLSYVALSSVIFGPTALSWGGVHVAMFLLVSLLCTALLYRCYTAIATKKLKARHTLKCYGYETHSFYAEYDPSFVFEEVCLPKTESAFYLALSALPYLVFSKVLFNRQLPQNKAC